MTGLLSGCFSRLNSRVGYLVKVVRMIQDVFGDRKFFLSMLGIGMLTCGLVLFLWDNSNAKPMFVFNKDNSIQVGDIHFPTLEEYVASDYFRENGRRCGTKRPVATGDDKLARSVNDCTLQLTRIQNEYWLSGVVIEIPVWFHVLYRSDGVGNISESSIRDQLKVLNEDYRALSGTMGSQGNDTRIRFTLAGITRTMNDVWFNDGDRTVYKAYLNQDPAKYANVYTNTAGGDLGYATFPQFAAGSSSDGIVVQYTTVGGRNNGNGILYNQGRTLVHEMGHYLGLYHTFDYFGSCGNSYSSGDLIVDTPSENIEHYKCANQYSCGTPDPIHNYMNYTPDSCMLEFTLEQANRMVCSVANYRPGLYNLKFAGAIAPLIEQLLLKKP